MLKVLVHDPNPPSLVHESIMAGKKGDDKGGTHYQYVLPR